MSLQLTPKELLASVCIYADADAFRRDEFGRPQYLVMKPLHDELYQAAMDLRLASSLVVMQRKRPVPALRDTFTVAVRRPSWHPANGSPSRGDLLVAPVSAFGRDWLGLRHAVEQVPKFGSLWHDDPALVFEAAPGFFMCRTACIGHEGEVLYFAYKRELDWVATLERSSLRLIGTGEAAYRTQVPTPGMYAEGDKP